MEYRIVNDTQLYHYGVPGMKWGVRKAPEQNGVARPRLLGSAPKKIQALKTDSKVTKQVKRDYNKMSDQEFFNKHLTSKKTYAKRVYKSKTGDPFADRRAKMSKRSFDKAVSREADLRTSQHLAKKAKAIDDSRTARSKTLTTAIMGKRGNTAYNTARAAGYTKKGAVFMDTFLGSEGAMNRADKTYKRSKEGRNYKNRIANDYYK